MAIFPAAGLNNNPETEKLSIVGEVVVAKTDPKLVKEALDTYNVGDTVAVPLQETFTEFAPVEVT